MTEVTIKKHVSAQCSLSNYTNNDALQIHVPCMTSFEYVVSLLEVVLADVFAQTVNEGTRKTLCSSGDEMHLPNREECGWS